MAGELAARSASALVGNVVRLCVRSLPLLLAVSAAAGIPAAILGLMPLLVANGVPPAGFASSIATYASGVLGLTAFCALVAAGLAVVAGTGATVGQSYRHVWRCLPRLAGAFLLVVVVLLLLALVFSLVAALLALVLDGAAELDSRAAGILVTVPPLVASGLIAAVGFVYLAPAVPAMLLERLGPLAALKRSYALVRGAFWRCLLILVGCAVVGYLILIAFYVTIAALALVLGLPSPLEAAVRLGEPADADFARSWLLTNGVYSAVVSILTLPLGAVSLVLLYLNLRVGKEGLDKATLAAELAR